MALDANVKALMRSTVAWEAYTGADVYNDESYAAAKQLACHIEDEVEQLQVTDEASYVPRHCLYFDAYDTDVQSFTIRDRFTAPGIAGGEKTQPQRIQPIYGPNGQPWVVAVTL